MDCKVHGVAKSRTGLGWEDPLEEEMATHSSILAWESPWTEEPGGLQSMVSQRVYINFQSMPSPAPSPLNPR